MVKLLTKEEEQRLSNIRELHGMSSIHDGFSYDCVEFLLEVIEKLGYDWALNVRPHCKGLGG